MAEYNRILIAGNPVLTSGNFTPDNFEYLKGEGGDEGAVGPKGQKGAQGPGGESPSEHMRG